MWRSIRVKLVAVYLLLILFALQLIGAYFIRTLTATLIRDDTEAAKNQAQLIATIAAPKMAAQRQDSAAGLPVLPSLPQLISGTVYVLNRDGVVVDTTAGPALVGQKRIDSVATQALVSRSTAVAIRYDPASAQHLLAVAVPIQDVRGFLGLVEYVVPVQSTYNTVRAVTTIFYTWSAIALVLTALLGIILARTITRPVFDVIRQSRQMAAGDFTQRLPVRGDDEFGDLAVAVNDLAEKLDQAVAANARERERLQAVIKYMGDGVLVFDAEWQLMFRNDAAARILPSGAGAQLRQLLGLDELQAGDRERSLLREIGDTIVDVHITTIQKNAEVEGYVAVLRDVTEQEKLQRARRDFVANVSHELRTPLTSIKSYIETLLDSEVDPGTQREFLQVINQETDRMTRLTEDLLQLSGLESGSAPFQPQPVDVGTWVADSVNRFHLQAKERGIRLSLHCTRTGVIRGDRDLLDRLLANIIGNALKYTPTGGAVTVVANLVRDELQLRVEDTGIGIPSDDIPHVFERFYRVDKARSRRMGGTGLGLAIAREIVERHGGTISIDSRLNSGTTVYITLPLAEEGSP